MPCRMVAESLDGWRHTQRFKGQLPDWLARQDGRVLA